LTLEDVLQQDPREKMDTFESLGYYFICARALDESYFKYTPGTSSSPPLFKPGGPSSQHPTNAPDANEEHGSGKKDRQRAGWGLGKAADMFANQLGREKVEIIEDNPGKEGLEGVGVGAVNVYLVVFADGVVSVCLPLHHDADSSSISRISPNILNGF
jgi:magnesium transporter